MLEWRAIEGKCLMKVILQQSVPYVTYLGWYGLPDQECMRNCYIRIFDKLHEHADIGIKKS